MADATTEPARAPTLLELEELANAGDSDALNEIIERFRGDRAGLIRFGYGDLARTVQHNALNNLFDKHPVVATAVRARMEQIRDDLAGPAPSPLERLLAERAALCWLDVHIADLLKAGDGDRGSLGKTLKIGEARDRRCTRANDRYLKALKALATVRKLDLPRIQINVAERQVNVSGLLASE